MRWTWRDFISIAVLPVLIFVALVLPTYWQSQFNDVQTQIACISARTNISQLEALAALERRLGIPQDFKIPEVPPECDGH